MNLSRRTLALLLSCLIPTVASAIQVTVPLITQAPEIDGKVTAEEQGTAVSAPLTKIGGLDQPRFGTHVFISTTLDGLYVAFVADEPHLDSLVTSTTQENGPVFNDDSVQVFITPSLDTAADAYYHFAVNADGVRYSNHLISGQVIDNWQVAVSKGDKRWEAEFFIPHASINAPDELPLWRANFARVRPAHGNQAAETSAWVNPGISLHNYKKFGYITMPRLVPAAPTGAAVPYTTETVEIISTETIQRQRDQQTTATAN